MSAAGKNLSPWFEGEVPDLPERELGPHLQGATVYADRYGTLADNNRVLGAVAVLAVLLAAVAVSFALWLAHQPKAIPYVVAVDKVGRAVAVAPADKASSVDEQVVRAEVGRFFFLLRSVVGGDEAQKAFVRWVYQYLPKNSPAYRRAHAFYKANYEEMRGKRVEVDVTSIDRVPRSDDYMVEFVERELDHSSSLIEERRLTGYATIKVQPARMFENGHGNPLGVFVMEFSVTQQPGGAK